MSIRPDFWNDIARMVSVDVETAGPNPADYALLSIGACTLLEPRATFYAELQPTTRLVDENAMKIHRLDMDLLSRNGLPPKIALQNLADWLTKTISDPRGALFLGFNASFDWMFLNDYFHHFLCFNPFGHSAVDIKSFAMGLKGAAWEATKLSALTDTTLQHNALGDSLVQADIFMHLIQDNEKLSE